MRKPLILYGFSIFFSMLETRPTVTLMATDNNYLRKLRNVIYLYIKRNHCLLLNEYTSYSILFNFSYIYFCLKSLKSLWFSTNSSTWLSIYVITHGLLYIVTRKLISQGHFVKLVGIHTYIKQT